MQELKMEGTRLDRAIDATVKNLLGKIVPADSPKGGYWLGELEADTTLESDYILFLYYLNPDAHREKIRKLANTIRRAQLSDGSWNIYHGGPGEVSASVKAYFALKLAEFPTGEPFIVKAREAILRMGGAEKVNTFTKIYLTFLNQFDWSDVPAIPPEIVLLPRFFYFNIYEISYWSRAILIPLSILYAKKPNRPVDENVGIREVFLNGNGTLSSAADRTKNNGAGNGQPQPARPDRLRANGNQKAVDTAGLSFPKDPNLLSWRNFFLLADRLLKLVERAPIKPLRNLALKKAEEWMVSRTQNSDGLGAIFPAMVNSVMAMRCLGYGEDHPCVATTLRKLRELEIEEGDELRLQPCHSPVWDTALAINALREAGVPKDAPQIVEGARWLVAKEVRKSGDWQLRVGDVDASGWYFQFHNEFYPDVDDTAAVLLALDRVEYSRVEGMEAAIGRGINWLLSMQCRDGGWAAFDVDVDHGALTQVPYADHNAMLDPSCSDITGRTLEVLGRYPQLRFEPRIAHSIRRGVDYLKKSQEADGSWYGRWGVNFIYGTWQAIKGLTAVGEEPGSPAIRRAVDWLKRCQNPDGGWGETCESYCKPALKAKGPSTASQTSWAVMALAAAGEVEAPETERGVEFLLRTQEPDGAWSEEEFTGTGFPGVFYLRYHLYSVYFPLFALGYYRNLKLGIPSPRGPGSLELPPARGGRRSLELLRRVPRSGLFGKPR